MPRLRRALWLAPLVLAAVRGAPPSPAATRATADYVPAELSNLVSPRSSELRELVERYEADRDDLVSFYSVDGSDLQDRRLREFYAAWAARLEAVPYERLGQEGRIDWILLRREVDHAGVLLDREEARRREMAPLIPFAEDLARLQEARRLMQPVDPQAAAAVLESARSRIQALQERLGAGLKTERTKPAAAVEPMTTTPITAYRAIGAIGSLRQSLEDWYGFYDGYDPAFGWWVRASHDRLKAALDAYVAFLREKVVGAVPGRDEPIVGDPIGRDGIEAELAHEMIAYTPEELLAIADREFTWCDAELRKASREMGCGDDWKAALEKVKADHVPPGGQPALVRDLALEAIRFVQDRDLVTIPPLAADFWRMEMMSPERQKVAPFFLGGKDISVAYPTDSMDYDDKIQSLRANNVHFARATVFHELVPGHHLQYYYESRINPHRTLFRTPFWTEGWAVWWEFQFWDLGFPRGPEDRIGMLFWRAHRCARIIFSLKFHLGQWTPQQCIDFLVARVGHERESATGEVRRSFNGSYPPLYQAGYMLGALELRALHRELVHPGGMTDRAFHDAILAGGPMPIELVRVRLKGESPPKDFKPRWRFADDETSGAARQ
jgi:uncharacterized protein (DUF885 family)